MSRNVKEQRRLMRGAERLVGCERHIEINGDVRSVLQSQHRKYECLIHAEKCRVAREAGESA